MKTAGRLTLLAAFLAAAVLCFGQQAGTFGVNPQSNSSTQSLRWCDPTGTWYGGSDMTTPYHMTIAPVGIAHYSFRTQLAIDYNSLGILEWTDWSGEMTLGRGQKYDLYGVAFFVLSPDLAAAMGGSLDMDAFHSTMEFSGNCNTLLHTITTYIGYIPWTADKVPFVTNPDYNYLEMIGVQSIIETYYRMPTSCPNCPFSGAAAKSAFYLHAPQWSTRKR
ncbi:MAG TPA: hypothetical protein VMG35_09360 [Bryobacteraceae bacterium]|nr:hypothetical protein [Bryobacteraceae bacterium]